MSTLTKTEDFPDIHDMVGKKLNRFLRKYGLSYLIPNFHDLRDEIVCELVIRLEEKQLAWGDLEFNDRWRLTGNEVSNWIHKTEKLNHKYSVTYPEGWMPVAGDDGFTSGMDLLSTIVEADEDPTGDTVVTEIEHEEWTVDDVYFWLDAMGIEYKPQPQVAQRIANVANGRVTYSGEDHNEYVKTQQAIQRIRDHAGVEATGVIFGRDA